MYNEAMARKIMSNKKWNLEFMNFWKKTFVLQYIFKFVLIMFTYINS